MLPSRDVQWLIGTIVIAAIALGVQMAGIQNDLGEIRTDLRRLDDRLRVVENGFTGVNQRLETLERVINPSNPPQ